jgi:hypothetical protein
MDSKQPVEDDSLDHSDTGPKIKIKVCRGSTHYDLTVSPDSTFGDLKQLISHETGLEPKKQRLFFRGIEKENEACLQMAGLKNNSKLLLREDTTYGEEIKVEDVKEDSVPSKGSEAVAVVRSEDDKLAEQVAALKTVVCGGTKVAEKDIIFLIEMLERQLLKLDGIEADGEGRIQRKMEVRRVQSLVDTMDDLKAKNHATPMGDDLPAEKPNIEGSDAESPMSSSTKVAKDWEVFE